MKQFVAVIHHEDDSAYGLTFPDFPGCFAAADDMDGVVAAGVEALTLWFEDQPDDTEPTALDKVDPDGGALVLIPWVGRSARNERVNVMLPKATLDAVDAHAKLRHMNRSEFLAAAALAEIEGRHS